MSDRCTLQVIDSRFKDLTFPHVRLERISSGHLWTEGPVWFADHQFLLFSDIPNNKIFRWNSESGASVYRTDSNFANGNTRDKQGRLITCEHGSRSVTRTEIDGSITILANEFEGKRLNSPNDVVVKSDGTIWFTDPSYGIMSDFEGNKASQEQSGCFVFKLDPKNGKLAKVASGFSQPNGLAFSNDETLLYVSESGFSHNDSVPQVIRVFSVSDSNSLRESEESVTVDSGVPDGFRVDTFGNIWTSAADGVHCFTSEGTLLGKILVPEVVSNVTFGGARLNQLFITATTSLYAIHLNTAPAS